MSAWVRCLPLACPGSLASFLPCLAALLVPCAYPSASASLAPSQVHRGVYEAAQQLYDRFLPLVQEHLASSPFAKVG